MPVFAVAGFLIVLGSARLSAAVPAINSATSVTGQVGVAFTYQITATNTPTSFNAIGLPAGQSNGVRPWGLGLTAGIDPLEWRAWRGRCDWKRKTGCIMS